MEDLPAVVVGMPVTVPNDGALGVFTRQVRSNMEKRLARLRHKGDRLDQLMDAEEKLWEMAGEVQAARVRATYGYLVENGLMPDTNGNGKSGSGNSGS